MSHRRIGIVALVAAAWLVVGNVTHPVGSTELYTDGAAFSEYADTTYWVVNHVLIAIALMVTPWLAWGWRETLRSLEARTWGMFGLILMSLGTVFSVFHLAGIDGVAIPAYADVLASGGDAAVVGADLFMRIHLASITTWAILLWGGSQLVVGIAEIAEGTRRLLGWLMVVCGGLGFAFAWTVALTGHLTGFSEGVLFRGATVGFTVWLIWTAWEMAKSDRPAVQPA
jgi:hypothetical protein